jgi:hypothetical protein
MRMEISCERLHANRQVSPLLPYPVSHGISSLLILEARRAKSSSLTSRVSTCETLGGTPPDAYPHQWLIAAEHFVCSLS